MKPLVKLSQFLTTPMPGMIYLETDSLQVKNIPDSEYDDRAEQEVTWANEVTKSQQSALEKANPPEKDKEWDIV
jgi:hypothetical protein